MIKKQKTNKMKSLSKIHHDNIVAMINNRENLTSLKAYCQGAVINTDNYSSAIHIMDNKVTIKYRGLNKYYYL